MKRILLLLFTFFSIVSFAQVGVNTTTPDPSSMLDISATNKGVLVPRVSLTNVTITMLDGTNTAATGLLIWNTNAATIGGNGVGYYFFNGTIWVPVMQTASSDHDWYEVGGTTPPNSITDNKYTQGSVTIGTTAAATGVLDVDNATKSTSLDINNTFATNPTGINLNITTNTAGKNGIKTEFNGTSTNGTNSFISNTDNLIGNTSRTGISNDFNGSSSSGSTLVVGLKNNFKNTSNYLGSIHGVVNTFESNTAANRVGLINNFINGGSNVITGVINSFNGTGGTGIAKAIRNISFDYSGIVYGMDNTFEGNGDGNHYGVYNLLSGYGTGDKYGVYNSISNTAGGIHYGIYSDVLKTGSYAGYFLGNVSIGTTTANNYILPASRGINGQIMQTDGSGNVSWTTPTTGTDDQNLTTPTLTGTTLNLGIENGTGTSVDLASLKDHDWYEIGTTTAPNDINDNIFTQGKVAIGKNTASYRFEVEETGPGAAFPPVVAKFTDNSTSVNDHTGVSIDMNASTSSPENGLSINLPNPNSTYKKGVVSFTLNGTGTNNAFEGRVSGSGLNLGSSLIIFDSGNPSSSQQKGYEIQFRQPTTGNTYGLLNTFMTNNLATDSGAKYGIYNNFGINTGGELYGVYNNFSATLTSTLNKYGTFTDIPSTLGGTHYGIFSRVYKSGSFAGYFQGNVAIGTNGSNYYILPPSRGSNGQIMQTDVSGNVSWVTPTTGTDDQNLTTPTLTGTTLNLGIENGTGTSINLASLQDGTGTDDQNLTTPTLTGTTLNLGIENGTGTSINLASLQDGTGTDDQNLTTPTLTGTTLNLGIENGTGTSINLASLQTNDHDWYEVGSTNPPNNINDSKYTLGNVAIGKNSINTDTTFDINSTINNIGVNNLVTVNSTTDKIGIKNTVNGINSDGAIDGIENNLLGSADLKIGIKNNFEGNGGTGSFTNPTFAVHTGVFNEFKSTGTNIAQIGFKNHFNPAGVISNNSSITGFENSFDSNFTNASNLNSITGLNNSFTLDSDDALKGIQNTFSGSGIGTRYGLYNNFLGDSNAYLSGVTTYISSTGIGTKYGEHIIINNTAGGTHYGIYSDVQKSGSFAGYFIGNVSIGTNSTNNYILPPSRGTNGQIIQTDGTGVLSWVTPTTGTDDQNLTTPTLTGTTLNLGIENGTGTSINLSGLQDSDWYEVGGTNPANNIADNIYTDGDVSIGKNTAALAKLDIDANNKLNTLILDNNNTTSGSKNGINNSLTLTSSSSFSYGIRNSITGVGDWKYGIRNFINSNSSSLINELGIENFFTSIGNSNIWGYNNFYSPISSHVGNYFGFSNNVGSNHIGGVSGVYNSITSNTATYMHGVNNNLIGTGNAEVIGVNTTIGNSGTGNKYGEKITITNTLAGIHYGLYSDVTKTNSFAGYFLGNVSIGTDTSNNYILPPSQGTNGQIMQTNATGNVSWVNPPISESTTANNGLTEVGNNVQLGGSLVQNTSITQGNYNLNIDSSGTGNTSITNTGSANIALEITKTDNSVTDQYSIYNTKSSLNSSVDYALFNELTGTGTGIQYLTYNNMSTTGTGTKYGVYNNFEITSPAAKYGVYNNFLSNTGNYYGMLNNMTGSTSQAVFGVTNTLTGSGTGAKTGITNSFSGANGNVNPYNGLDNTFIDSGNGERSGVKNNMTGTGNGTHYGNYNELTGTGSGNKFGTYNLINSGAGGIHYGTYNSVNPANGWAGYFIGNSYFSYKVGIGEINPSGFLEVRAANSGAEPNLNLVNIGAAGARINFTDTNTTSNVWTLYGDTDNVVANSAFNIFHTTTGNIMRVTGDGLVGIMRAPTTNQLEINGTASKSAAGGFLANSDSRLKKNIVTISPTDALNKVLSLRGVTYEWNDDKTGMNRPEGMQLGFVAQEIQQVFPEKVSEDKQGYLQTAYGDYDPIIFQAIKALSDKIDKLEKENEELKKIIEKN